MKPNPLFTWARSSINRVGTAVVRVCDLWSGWGAQAKVLWMWCQLMASQVPLLWWLLPAGESFGQTSCLLPQHLKGNTHHVQPQCPRPGQQYCFYFYFSYTFYGISLSVCSCMAGMCWTAKASDSKWKLCRVCLIWKLFWEVSNTKYWLDSVNHSHYSCLFSTVSPRFNHSLHWGRQLQGEPFPSTVASGCSVSYYFLQKTHTPVK